MTPTSILESPRTITIVAADPEARFKDDGTELMGRFVRSRLGTEDNPHQRSHGS